MSYGLNYPKWKAHTLAARVKKYTGYVGCGCPRDGEHDPLNRGCARADFARLARELAKRVRRPSPSVSRGRG
jgi:hypothetical protein